MEEQNASLDELINEIHLPLWQAAARARLAEERSKLDSANSKISELEDLKLKRENSMVDLHRLWKEAEANINRLNTLKDVYSTEAFALQAKLRDANLQVRAAEEVLRLVRAWNDAHTSIEGEMYAVPLREAIEEFDALPKGTENRDRACVICGLKRRPDEPLLSDRCPLCYDRLVKGLEKRVDLSAHPELLKVHPLTCGECRAEIRTDLCQKCALLVCPTCKAPGYCECDLKR